MKPTAAVMGLLAVAAASISSAERLERQAGRAGRSPTIAPHGMVAAEHPLAVQVGLDVLKRGGNAVDAAIAVNAMLGLTEPMMCGIGGDLYALVWDAKTQKLYGLNASGRAPYKATIEYFKDKGMDQIPNGGPLSWSVPGCVDGWETLRKRFGTMGYDQLLEPSIRYAEAGVPVPEIVAGYWRQSEPMLRRDPDSAKTFLIDGRAPRHGEVFRNPYLAKTYREIASGGRDAYYRGRIAREIVAASEKHGGLFTMKDFEDHTSTWVEPAGTNYRGVEVWEIPPPGQGIAALQILNLLEPYDLKAMGAESADWWHLFIEAKKLAYEDRGRYYADPEFVKVPIKELISKQYAAERRKLIDSGKAGINFGPGDPKLGSSETTYFCVVDKDRNCVSMIQSNFNGFGSGVTPGDLGFGLQNRGTLFALDPKHPNKLEPHKRPFHTIIPGMATKNGKPWMVFGVMGGDMQAQGHVQILVNMIDFGMNIQAAGEAPRIEHKGSSTPKGVPAEPGGGTIEVEEGLSGAAIDELARRGHHVKKVRINGGGYQGIMIDPATNMLHGGSEARKDGYAAGY